MASRVVKRFHKFGLAAVATALPALSFAYDWTVVGHVTLIEPSNVPAVMYVAIDQNAGSCPAGPWLVYSGNLASNNLPENVKAMYAALQVALVTGAQVEVSGMNAGCAVINIHFRNN